MTRGEALLAWYRSAARDLPWRGTADPYLILVSEVMLQQTQVARVVPVYQRFVERFPTVEAVAEARLGEILEVWRGLGYNIRARRLRDASRIVASEGWPRTAAGLRRLPGVGPYTAAAVASIAFGERIPAIDTNVRRVLSRWFGEPLSGAGLRGAAGGEVAADAGSWNQAVMDLGATVCRTRDPRCDLCPVASWCEDPSIYQPPRRQSAFLGSDRQVRGAVLGSLGPTEWRTHAELARSTGHPEARVREATESLSQEGMIDTGPRGVRIAR
ncbi:MAG TPA: A/G-specific adenine glycosylase [Acidimicrobiia bacterium]|nr:A/G-specific adenine glycosylase [Acidimicrobiia bacterium]